MTMFCRETLTNIISELSAHVAGLRVKPVPWGYSRHASRCKQQLNLAKLLAQKHRNTFFQSPQLLKFLPNVLLGDYQSAPKFKSPNHKCNLIMIVKCDSNRAAPITSNLKQCEPSDKLIVLSWCTEIGVWQFEQRFKSQIARLGSARFEPSKTATGGKFMRFGLCDFNRWRFAICDMEHLIIECFRGRHRGEQFYFIFQERKISPKRKFWGGYPCGYPAENFGQALQILEKEAFWHRHAARTSMKKLRSEKLRADFSFPNFCGSPDPFLCSKRSLFLSQNSHPHEGNPHEGNPLKHCLT